MKISATPEYRSACAALSALKAAGAQPESLRAIAGFLILAHDGTLPATLPYRGDPADPRDIAIAQAYRDAWANFVLGDDDEP